MRISQTIYSLHERSSGEIIIEYTGFWGVVCIAALKYTLATTGGHAPMPPLATPLTTYKDDMITLDN